MQQHGLNSLIESQAVQIQPLQQFNNNFDEDGLKGIFEIYNFHTGGYYRQGGT